MPTAAGPNSNEQGLVFAIDLGDIKNSYIGEPTTNILNNNILGQGNGAFLSSDSVGTYIQLANLTSSYSRFQLPSIPVSSNDTYTWSFELMSPQTITTGYYFDTNEYSDQFPTSNDLSRASATHRVPSTMPAGVWQEFSLTVTMKSNLTGAYTYDFFNMLYPTFQNKKVYYRNMQFEFKNHPTQYVGQGATRSATQGLLDLTGNSTLDISNMSFNSNAELVFDGTDDGINVGNATILSLSNGIGSVEAVVKFPSSWTAGSQYPNLISKGATAGWDTDGWALFGFRDWGGPKSWGFGMRNGATNRVTSRNNCPADVYLHIVATIDGSTIKLYENGVLYTTNTQTINPAANNTNVYIGRDASSQRFPGEIPVAKIYNRTLSAEEVANNYNVLKKRFNI